MPSQINQITNLTGVRVLLVDADPRVASGLRKVLVSSGCNVFSTGSARRARRYVGRMPDVVVLDTGLPGTEWAELLGWLGELPRRPRIVVTGRYPAEVRERAGQAGADAFVVKPYTLVDVVAGVRRVLDRSVHPRVGMAGAAGTWWADAA